MLVFSLFWQNIWPEATTMFNLGSWFNSGLWFERVSFVTKGTEFMDACGWDSSCLNRSRSRERGTILFCPEPRHVGYLWLHLGQTFHPQLILYGKILPDIFPIDSQWLWGITIHHVHETPFGSLLYIFTSNITYFFLVFIILISEIFSKNKLPYR